MDVWVISNPGSSAVGCPHPRPNPAEGREELQLEGFEFEVFTEEEYTVWRLSRGFNELVAAGLLLTTKTDLDSLPRRKKVIPDSIKPENDYDHQIAYQLALAPEQTDDMQFARINLFRSSEPGAEWVPEADTTYLKTRHLPLLEAAEWYLTEYMDVRQPFQGRRLRDIRRQIKAIKSLT
jgi:hypothetical protein